MSTPVLFRQLAGSFADYLQIASDTIDDEVIRQLAGSFADYFQIAGDAIDHELISEKCIVIHLRRVTANLLNSQLDVFKDKERIASRHR